MDAITLLKDDHKTVEKLFKRFERAGDEAYAEKREIVDRIIEELSVHAEIEEQFFYPVVRATVPDTEDTTLESLEEHHVAKWVLNELDGMDPEHERFDAKVTVLIENVRHHVEEEEQDLFPKVRDELGRGALAELGEALEAAKALAPTHPHPASPDTPPGNLIAGAAAGVADRITDTVSGVGQGSVNALGDLVARVLGRKRRTPKPTGSSRTRSTAETVRSGAADATRAVTDAILDAERRAGRAASDVVDDATETADRARKAASSTATRATKAAKSSASSARRSGRRATSTAKRASSGAKRSARSSTGSGSKAASKAKASSSRSGKATKKAASRSRTKATAKS